MTRLITTCLLLGLLAMPTSLSAQSPRGSADLGDNAALDYWRAFALLPQIDKEKERAISAALEDDADVSEEYRELVRESENALRYLHRGASMKPCDWGVDREEGPYAYLPHLAKTRQLARVALLRAKMRFEDGQFDDGIDDAIAVLQMGRHTGQDGVIVLINVLVDYAIETQTIALMANSLHRLEPTHRERFLARYNAVRPRLGMTAAMQGEKDIFLGWLIRHVKDEAGKQPIMDLVSGDTRKEVVAKVENASRETLIRWAGELGQYYDSGFAMLKLPPAEALEAEQKWVDPLDDPETGNPLGELFLPSFGAARRAEATLITRQTLLRAALAVFQKGPEALNTPELRDPFGDSAFEWKTVDGAAVLVSDLKPFNDEAVQLRVPGLGR